MIGAIVKNNIVENVIVIDEPQIPEIEEALGCEIVDARPYGLAIGDLRTERGWTRNAGGEQMVLEALEPEQYDGYSEAMRRADEAEEQAKLVAEAIATEAINDAIAILREEMEKDTAVEPIALMSVATANVAKASTATRTALAYLIAKLEAIPAAVVERWNML